MVLGDRCEKGRPSSPGVATHRLRTAGLAVPCWGLSGCETAGNGESEAVVLSSWPSRGSRRLPPTAPAAAAEGRLSLAIWRF